jgi:hypothetical protein
MTNGEIHSNDETVSDFDSKLKSVLHQTLWGQGHDNAAGTAARWELSTNAGLPWSCPTQRSSPSLQLRNGHNHDSSTTVTATSALTNGEIHSNDETVSGFVTRDSTSWNVLPGERGAIYRTM